MPRRYFQLEEAIRLLPWLREQFAAVTRCREQIAELDQQIDDLSRHSQRNGASDIGSIIREKRLEVRQLSRELQAAVTAIQRRGVIVRDFARGLVDFPSRRDDGQDLLLCWLVEEETIGYWHPTDTGFGDRQPL